MDAVLLCLTTQHDPRLILAAGLVCLIGLATASSLGARAGAASGGRRRDLAAAAGAMAGLTVWTTHFVAMLGFRPGVPTGYDLPITAASFAVALGFGVGAAYLALSGSAVRRVLAAVVAASGVAAMHFLGMSGLVVPGVLVWDPVLASVAVAAVGSPTAPSVTSTVMVSLPEKSTAGRYRRVDSSWTSSPPSLC